MPARKCSGKLPLAAAAGALFCMLLASQSAWIWNSIYFQLQSAAEIALAFTAPAAFIALGTRLLQGAMGEARTHRLINLMLVVLLCMIVFNGLRGIGLIPHSTTLRQKITAIALAVPAAFFLAYKVSQPAWQRAYPALAVAGIIFTFSPWLFASNASSAVYWPSPGDRVGGVGAPALPRQNTIILLLDEFSAGAAAPLIEQFKALHWQVASREIAASGDDTVNVIPAIWLKANFDHAAPCGPTQLCSDGKVLDFAKTTASARNIDVIAFYHRYCDMQGLRSCKFYPFRKKPALTELACAILKKPSFLPLDCNPSAADRRYFAGLRADMQQALMDAPFWRQGGILYAHLMQPHPLMGVAEHDLGDEYAGNIEDSAALVKRIAQKAQATFGDDFRIVIFSDHPLRPDVWCGAAGFYPAGQCKPQPEQLAKQVPLIVATPSQTGLAQLDIDSNLDVFDLLFR